MSQVRQAVSIPLATNMCLVAWDQLAPGIRMRAVDVILSDLHYWGGFQQNRKMMAVAEAFNLGIGMHSDRELGISTSAMLHLAAATPYITYAIDSHYHDQLDDLSPCRLSTRAAACACRTVRPWCRARPRQARPLPRSLRKGRRHQRIYDPARPDWIPACRVSDARDSAAGESIIPPLTLFHHQTHRADRSDRSGRPIWKWMLADTQRPGHRHIRVVSAKGVPSTYHTTCGT